LDFFNLCSKKSLRPETSGLRGKIPYNCFSPRRQATKKIQTELQLQ
jgi:hypothetical protein